MLCVPCVERALESREATPEQARTHFRQALLSLLLGIGAWLVGLIAFVMAVVATASSGEMNAGVILLMMLGLLGALVPAVNPPRQP